MQEYSSCLIVANSLHLLLAFHLVDEFSNFVLRMVYGDISRSVL